MTPGEVLWDRWGVPHIFADNDAALACAFGWAQMHSHGHAILRLYGEARGRAAEYWGERHLASDQFVRTFGIPARGREAYASQAAPFREYLDGFVSGVNAFARRYPDRFEPEVSQVLPIDGGDVLSHLHRLFFVLHAGPGGKPEIVNADGRPLTALSGGLRERTTQPLPGSNAWAIEPRRSASGHALLLVNLHLPWSPALFTMFEAQLVAPGIDFYGATLAGLPVPVVGFNEHLGWAHTVNTFDALDTYHLRLSGDAYVFDDTVRCFDTTVETITVREADGAYREEPLTIHRSVHGPVVTIDGKTLAVRSTVLDEHGALQQWWDMCRATTLHEFEAALERLQLPLLTVMYADRSGNIMHLFGGRMPKRPLGDAGTWAAPVPGDVSATLWTETHPYADLPKAIGSTCGWLQNSNCPPWNTARPSPLRKADFPPYTAPDFVSAREQRAVRMLSETEPISLADLVQCRYATRVELADRVLDDLIAAARATATRVGIELGDILGRWDRTTDADSRGALLFATWAAEMFPDSIATAGVFAVPWNPADPFGTPYGLAEPARAVTALKRAASMIMLAGFPGVDVPWGEVMRLCRNGVDLPGNGASGEPLGVFHVVDYTQVGTTRFEATGGDSFVAAIEFGEAPNAVVLLGYGNSSERGSRHCGDQLALLSQKQMRPAWRTRAEVEANLEYREVVSPHASDPTASRRFDGSLE